MKNTKSKTKEINAFLKECSQVRRSFAITASQYSVSEHLKLRTEIDSLIIMYDQLYERVKNSIEK